MQELPATWQRTLSVLWLIFWRSVVGAIIIGFVFGFVVGFVSGFVNALGRWSVDSTPIIIVGSAIGGFLWYLAVVRMALEKKYRDFRIALVPRD